MTTRSLALVVLLFLTAAMPAKADSRLPGLEDDRFQDALQDWLAGDDQSVREFSNLAREGNTAAIVLLSRVATTYTRSRNNNLVQEFEELTGLTIFFLPMALRELDEYHSNRTSYSETLIASSIHGVRGPRQRDERHDLIRRLVEAGEVRIAAQMSDIRNDPALLAELDALSPYHRIWYWADAVVNRDSFDLDDVRVREFVDYWHNGSYLPYYFLNPVAPVGITPFAFDEHLDPPPVLEDYALGMLIGGYERVIHVFDWDTDTIFRGLDDEVASALPRYLDAIETDPLFAPVLQLCKTMCPSEPFECTRAMVSAFGHELGILTNITSPAEAIVPQDQFLQLDRAVPYIFAALSSLDRPSGLRSADTENQSVDRVPLEDISACAVDNIEAYMVE